jgi:hypothetical protein
MRVHSCPKEVPAPEPDYTNYDREKEIRQEEEHMAKLAKWLRKAGYTGKHTGGIYRTGVADGCAQYMLGDKGRGGILIHLPYGDAWQSRDVQFLPKSEIVRHIEADKELATKGEGK